MSETAPWITYRPELKVLDCTIRDGGLINNHLFTDELDRLVQTDEGPGESETDDEVRSRELKAFLENMNPKDFGKFRF